MGPRFLRAHAGLTSALLAFAAATALASCIRSMPRDVAGPPTAPAGPRIDHASHLDKGLECVDCHMWRSDEDKEAEEEKAKAEGREVAYIEPGPPPYAACADCHDDEDAEKPDDKKIKNVFFDKDGKAAWGKAAWDYPYPIVFSHKAHQKRECVECHGELKTPDRRSGYLFTMDSCMACHTKNGGPTGCDDCHPGINSFTVPESHRHLWKERHGQIARTQLERAEGRCHYCHSDPFFCESCHKEEKPRSHNNLWRWKSHGIAASFDRTSCQVCHQTDFCVRCHTDTPPRSHRGLWARGINTHCADCHFPVASNDNCKVCHFQTPTHPTAPDQPANHVPGMNCRLCHNQTGGGGAPPLRHFDPGLQCESCHD